MRCPGISVVLQRCDTHAGRVVMIDSDYLFSVKPLRLSTATENVEGTEAIEVVTVVSVAVVDCKAAGQTCPVANANLQ